MANVTVAPGYIPECSNLQAADFNNNSALAFDPRKGRYYIDLWPTVVPALVFGGLAVVGLAFFLFWMCYQSRRTKRLERQRKEAAAVAQFVTEPAPAAGDKAAAAGANGANGAAAAAAAGPRAGGGVVGWLRPTWGRALKLFIVLLGMAVVGVSVWGMIRSIDATSNTISNFWGLVDVAEDKLLNASSSLQHLDEQLANVSYALNVTSNTVNRVPPLVMVIPGVKDVVNTLQTVPVEAKQEIDSVRGGVQDAINGIEQKGIQTIQNLRNNVYYWTSELETTWRFVVIAVVFGLTILFTFLAGYLVVWMGWPKLGSLSVTLLWLVVAILMFVGTGIFKGAYQVSSDSCLYAETFALRVVNESVTPPSTRDTVLLAMNYYFGFHDIPDDMVVYELFGANTKEIIGIVEGPLVTTVLDILGSTSSVLTTILNAVGVSKQDSATMLGLVDLVPETVDTVKDLERQVNRANVAPLIYAFKEWLCCDLKVTLDDIWEAWTIAGCLGWALGAACSARVIMHTLGMRRGGAPAGAGPGPAEPAEPASPQGLGGAGGDVEKATPAVLAASVVELTPKGVETAPAGP